MKSLTATLTLSSLLVISMVHTGCGLTDAEDDDSDTRSCVTLDDNDDLEGGISLDDDCYEVTEQLTVTSGETIVEAGTTLYFSADTGLSLEQSATLTVRGTAEAPVELRGEQRQLGIWRGIQLRSPGPHLVEHARIDGGGSSSWTETSAGRGGVVITANAVDAEFRDVEFHNHEHAAILTDAGLADFAVSDARFVDNDVPMRLHPHHPDGIGSGLSFADNRRDDIVIRTDEPLTREVRWPAVVAPYHVEEIVPVEGTLTIASGTTVEFGRDAGLDVDGGRLVASATVHDPIRLTGSNGAAGYWRGLRIHDTGSNAPSELDHTEVLHAGSERWIHEWPNSQANILVDDGGHLVVNHTHVAHGDYHGISVRDATVEGCQQVTYDDLYRHRYHTYDDGQCG